MPSIYFHYENITLNNFEEAPIINLIYNVAKSEGFILEEINCVFCNDEYLLQKNRQFLNHDYYTDVITFDYSETKNIIIGEIYISEERVIENALKYKVALSNERHRVIIHGLLHLCGYNDKSSLEKKKMREKEDAYLSLLL